MKFDNRYKYSTIYMRMISHHRHTVSMWLLYTRLFCSFLYNIMRVDQFIAYIFNEPAKAKAIHFNYKHILKIKYISIMFVNG